MKGYTIIEVITAIFIFLAILATILWPFIGGAIHYSSGKRVGEIIKFSERGFFVRNWCGEISIGGQGQAGYVFDFGIDRTQNNQKLIDKLNNLNGQRVEITYDQRGAYNLFNGCSDYLVIDVKAVK